MNSNKLLVILSLQMFFFAIACKKTKPLDMTINQPTSNFDVIDSTDISNNLKNKPKIVRDQIYVGMAKYYMYFPKKYGGWDTILISSVDTITVEFQRKSIFNWKFTSTRSQLVINDSDWYWNGDLVGSRIIYNFLYRFMKVTFKEPDILEVRQAVYPNSVNDVGEENIFVGHKL